MVESDKVEVKTSEIIKSKIKVGSEVNTTTGHKATILALDAKVGRNNDIVALINVNDELDFLEW